MAITAYGTRDNRRRAFRIQQLLRRPFFRNLLHKLFSHNQPLFNQEFRQGVSLRKARDEQLFHRDGPFIWFCHCASSFDYSIRPIQDRLRNRPTDLFYCLEINHQLEQFLSFLVRTSHRRICQHLLAGQRGGSFSTMDLLVHFF